MSFNNANNQRNDKQPDILFSSYLGPPATELEEEESKFLKHVDQVAKVAFVNGIVALVLTSTELIRAHKSGRSVAMR